jgi:hypothetical protein
MLPWSFSEEAAAKKYMAQVQHNMSVTHLRSAVLSIITGGGKWVEITIPMDPLYLSVLVSAEKKFWWCVQSGEPPHLINAEPPRARMEEHCRYELIQLLGGVRGAIPQYAEAILDHERAKVELKGLMPEDAKEAIGQGVSAKHSKTGVVSFDVLDEAASASIPVNRLALWPRLWRIARRGSSSTWKNRSLQPSEPDGSVSPNNRSRRTVC